MQLKPQIMASVESFRNRHPSTVQNHYYPAYCNSYCDFLRV